MSPYSKTFIDDKTEIFSIPITARKFIELLNKIAFSRAKTRFSEIKHNSFKLLMIEDQTNRKIPEKFKNIICT